MKKITKTGLPENLKSGVESLSGVSIQDVKVHFNLEKPVQLNAQAFLQGSDIKIAIGEEKHLPHEVWHVVQQSQGRVQATRQLGQEMSINNAPDLEKEADEMGLKATKKSENLNSK